MDTKASVVKSKSSNSTKTNHSSYHDQHKKSRSNVEFQPNVLKKRGVYVEKKYTNVVIDETAENQTRTGHVKAPRRPKASNKKFLTSILTILSKSTTGTQYPDTDDTITKKKRRRVNIRNNPNNANNNAEDEIIVKRKTKYKSKVLNDDVEKEVNQEKVVVIQSQKEMIQTPSVRSENGSYNWSNLPMLVKNGHQTHELIEKNVQEVANELAKEIMEGHKTRKDKRVRIDERYTYEYDNKKELINNATNDKGLYNFFVDLLESTISVYNIKAEYEQEPNITSDTSSVKIPLEIDESVANKLVVWRPNQQKADEAAQPENSFYCLADVDHGQNECCPPPLLPSKRPRKKKVVAESFSFLRNPTKKHMKTASVVETRKYSRKEKKKTLINLFKEQLRMDPNDFEEPQNMYEALKVIAENKERCQKTIHFENSVQRNKKDMGYPECMFKRRKVISPSTKLTKNNNARPIPTPSVSGRYSEISSRKIQKSGYVSDNDSSYHSLEVYGLDFIKPAAKKQQAGRQKQQFVFTYHSTPSSGSELGSDDKVGLTDSEVFCNEYYDF